MRTLSVLKNMSQEDASQFERLAQYVINGDFIFFDHFLKNNIQHSSDLEYTDFQYLAECGLAVLSDTSVLIASWNGESETVLSYHPDYLMIEKMPDAQDRVEIPAHYLTTAGRELYKILKPNAHTGYLKDLSTFLLRKKCRLSILENSQKIPNETVNYSKKVLVDATPIRPGEVAMR